MSQAGCITFLCGCRYEVISTPTDIFVVMEYVPNGELFEHIVQKGRVRRCFCVPGCGGARFFQLASVHTDAACVSLTHS